MTQSQATTAGVDRQAFRARVLGALDAARRRSLALTDCLSDAELVAQHSPLMSPMVWDLAHVGNVEEIHLVRQIGGREPIRPDLDGIYDALEHPRPERPRLPLLEPREARRYIAEVRAQAADALADADLDEAATRELLAFVAQHEQQHDETMLITHQMRRGEAVLDAPRPEAAGPGPPTEVPVPGGAFSMGTSTDQWALDNEGPEHWVEVAPFRIDAAPVTCGDFQAFIDDGGYDDPRWWSPDGWRLRLESRLHAPLFWHREDGRWTRRRFGRTEPVPAETPVVHVSWYEADAYARWAGRRLPTEAEWEKAARWDGATGETRRNPWGGDAAGTDRANLGQSHLEPAPAGSYPGGEAPCGARQMLGDVWEWTTSDFGGYPGFRPFPSPEYSAVFFNGRYKVLRGGSFGTHPDACRATFRNWDFPARRQIFSGFRTVRDAT
ncbi:ergothioneine biosynthesis protein EgtB [Glycomyces xiaoerkulensis]|uniref:ergothioneine biosynthesis protein EgtB n=1 Tax=Glycomyces xiaoerkulensis TaxID=2038139 RepID=UPI000C26521D|nr:ergothioneine biosynthesis protein EgtB [Glycomyces xiaoerkulensis]